MHKIRSKSIKCRLDAKRERDRSQFDSITSINYLRPRTLNCLNDYRMYHISLHVSIHNCQSYIVAPDSWLLTIIRMSWYNHVFNIIYVIHCTFPTLHSALPDHFVRFCCSKFKFLLKHRSTFQCGRTINLFDFYNYTLSLN